MSATEKISIVITCHGKAKDLEIMLRCLEQQKINTGGIHSTAGHPVEYTMGGPCEHEREIIVVSDGEYGGSFGWGGELIEVPHEGGVGHHTRAHGIAKATGEWIVLTNADNYFVTGWLDRLVKNITPEAGLVYWDCVNNLWRWTANGGGTKFPGCRIKRGHIDLTCVAVRADIAKRVGFIWRDYEADYSYIAVCARECDRNGLNIVYIPEILAVHN